MIQGGVGRNESDHRNYYSLKITLTKSFQIKQHEAGGLRGVVVCGGVCRLCCHPARVGGHKLKVSTLLSRGAKRLSIVQG